MVKSENYGIKEEGTCKGWKQTAISSYLVGSQEILNSTTIS